MVDLNGLLDDDDSDDDEDVGDGDVGDDVIVCVLPTGAHLSAGLNS